MRELTVLIRKHLHEYPEIEGLCGSFRANKPIQSRENFNEKFVKKINDH